MSAGFYKRINGEIHYAPNVICTPTQRIKIEDATSYQYPVEGWFYFPNKETAYSIFNQSLDTTAITEEFIEEENQRVIAEEILKVQNASRAYLDLQLDPDGQILVFDGAAAGLPKCTAVKNWWLSVRKESYNRQALIEASLWDFAVDPCDFSSFGDKDHTIPEIMIECGL